MDDIDPRLVRRVLANLHADVSLLLERLDNLEHNGMLSQADASRGWRDRVNSRLQQVRELGLHTTYPAVEEPAPEAPAQAEQE